MGSLEEGVSWFRDERRGATGGGSDGELEEDHKPTTTRLPVFSRPKSIPSTRLHDSQSIIQPIVGEGWRMIDDEIREGTRLRREKDGTFRLVEDI